MSIQFNPLPTTTAAGSFATSSSGYIQGTAQNDPAVRNELSGGILGPNETQPMWGGVLISETTTPLGSGVTLPERSLGGYITRATSYPTSLFASSGTAGIATGFSVFDQNHAAINFPQSQVPTSQPGMLVNFYRFGSGARIPVACAPSLATLEGNAITQQVSWDTTAQLLIPYTPGFAQVTITNAVWANTSGGQNTYTVGTDISADLAAGDIVEIAGVVSTGGTGVGYNGQFVVVSINSTTLVVTFAAASSPGAYSSGGHVLAQGGALPVRILDVNIGNSMTVTYSATTGFANWNRTGSTAVILI